MSLFHHVETNKCLTIGEDINMNGVSGVVPEKSSASSTGEKRFKYLRLTNDGSSTKVMYIGQVEVYVGGVNICRDPEHGYDSLDMTDIPSIARRSRSTAARMDNAVDGTTRTDARTDVLPGYWLIEFKKSYLLSDVESVKVKVWSRYGHRHFRQGTRGVQIEFLNSSKEIINDTIRIPNTQNGNYRHTSFTAGTGNTVKSSSIDIANLKLEYIASDEYVDTNTSTWRSVVGDSMDYRSGASYRSGKDSHFEITTKSGLTPPYIGKYVANTQGALRSIVSSGFSFEIWLSPHNYRGNTLGWIMTIETGSGPALTLNDRRLGSIATTAMRNWNRRWKSGRKPGFITAYNKDDDVHIVGWYKNGVFGVYVNGVEYTKGNGMPLFRVNNPLTIGNWKPGSRGHDSIGTKIYSFRVWHEKLEPDKIAKLYSNGKYSTASNIESSSEPSYFNLIMEQAGMLLDGSPVILKDCTQALQSPNLEMDLNQLYQIKKGNKCLRPKEENSSEIVFGACDQQGMFRVHQEKKEAPLDYPDSFKAYVLFLDNESATIGDQKELKNQILSYPGYVPSKDKKVKLYYEFYDLDKIKINGRRTVNSISSNDIALKNYTLHCRIRLMIEEYGQNETIPEKTSIFHLVCDDQEHALYFSETPKPKKLMIDCTGKKMYRNNKLGRKGHPRKNDQRLRIGIPQGNRGMKTAKVDTTQFEQGMILGKGETFFRMIILNPLHPFLFLYHYPRGRNKNDIISISSFINPFRKWISRKSTIQTKDVRDKARNRKYIFELSKVKEGMENQSTLPEDIATLYRDIQENPTKFQDFKTRIQKIRSNITTKYSGNNIAINGSILPHLDVLMKTMNQLDESYKIIQSIKTDMLKHLSGLQLGIIYDESSINPTNVFSLKHVRNQIRKVNRVLKRIRYFQPIMDSEQDVTDEHLDLTKIGDDLSISLRFIMYVCKMCHYLKKNEQRLYKETNTCYDYASVATQSWFPFFNQTTVETDKVLVTTWTSLRVNRVMDLPTFIEVGRTKFENTPKHFFDIEFQEFYDYFFKGGIMNERLKPMNETHLNALIYTEEDPKGLLSYLEQLISSQMVYQEKHNTYVDILKIASEFDTITSSGSYAEVISAYSEKQQQYPLLSNMTLFANYVSQFEVGEVDSARLFVNAFKELKSTYNEEYYTEDVKEYAHLSEYYDTNSCAVKKTEYLIATFFRSKYQMLFQSALAEITMNITGEDLINKNDERVQGIMEPFVEGFTDVAAELYPSDPIYLHSASILTEENNSMDLITQGNWYAAGFDDCIDISFSYHCGNNDQNIANSMQIDGGNLNGLCLENQSSCDLDYSATLEYRDDDITKAIYLVLTNNDTSTTAETMIYEFDPDFNLNNVTKYTDDDFNYSLNTIVSAPTNNTFTFLSKVDNDDEVEGDKCLIDATHRKFKLFISTNNVLTLRYEQTISKNFPLSNGNDNDASYGAPPNSGYVYSIDDDKYNVGDNISKHGYVGYDGHFYSVNGSQGETPAYQEYDNYCFDDPRNIPSSITNCDDDESCIGFLISDNGSFIITDDNKKYLYPCENDAISNFGTYNHKKYTLGESFPNCLQDASGTQIIDYETYTDSLNKAGTMDQSKCGFDFLLSEQKSELDASKETLTSALKNVLQSFQSLSSKELDLIKDTDLKMEEIESLLKDYQALHTNMKKQTKKKLILQNQKQDSEMLYHSMQYKTAIFGVASILATLTLFQVMKK